MANCIHCGTDWLAHEPRTDMCPTAQGPYSKTHRFNTLWVSGGELSASMRDLARPIPVMSKYDGAVYVLMIDGRLKKAYADVPSADKAARLVSAFAIASVVCMDVKE